MMKNCRVYATNRLLCYSIIFFLNFNFVLIAQDSLKTKSFEQLKEKFYQNENDSIRANIYAKAYLKKAKKVKDTFKIADGFLFLARIQTSETIALQYADSIIAITKTRINKRHPGSAYAIKGNYHFYEGNYIEAFNEYLTASKYAKKTGNKLRYAILKFNIAILKDELGEKEEALELYKEFVNYLIVNKLTNKHSLYNRGLYALSDGYNQNQKLDSAAIYINKGIIETLKVKDSVIYNLLVYQSGINLYFKEKYYQAIDSLNKAKAYLIKTNPIDTMGIAMHDYYIGKSWYQLNNIPKGIYHLKKVDTVLNQSNSFSPELIDTYSVLIDHYKSKNDTKNQIKYIESFLRSDSILKSNYKVLSKKIAREYETKDLIEEKEKLIASLEKQNSKVSTQNIVISILLILSLLGVGYYYYRQQLYKKRFAKLLEKNSNNKEQDKLKTQKSYEIEVPDEIRKRILNDLESFERNYGFLNPKISISELSKELNTNSKYLSIIINTYKQKGFKNYINQLRIVHSINRLKEEPKHRKYTIKAIAREAGFNNSEVFSKSFYKITGIYPSYFIKQLEKR